MEKDNGGPAFPVVPTMEGAGQWGYAYPGMTLRDWFAGMADVTNIQADSVGTVEKILGMPCPIDPVEKIRWQFDFLAMMKGMFADAMLAERNRKD